MDVAGRVASDVTIIDEVEIKHRGATFVIDVLRGEPGNGAKLFRYLTHRELGGPEPGNWPVPTAD